MLHTNLRHLDPARFRNSVLTVFPEPDHWVEPIRDLGIPVETLGCAGLRDIPAGVRRLRKWLIQHRPDVIHTHLWAANIIGRVAGRLTGIPVISSIHNPEYEPEAWKDRDEVPKWKRRLALVLDRHTAHFGCQRMVAVSEYVRGCTEKRLDYPLDQIDLIYNPVDVKSLQMSPPRTREEVLHELGLPSTSRILLSVGRVSPQKGLIYAVRALPEILKEHPTTQLISLGDTSDERWLEQLQAEALKLGVAKHIHFLGARHDVADFLGTADLFVFPSLYEGLGIALIEAMGVGCASVATTTGPIPEVVSNREDGWLVPPGDERSLAQAVCALLEDDAQRVSLGKRAAASTLARFQPAEAAGKLAKVYESVVTQFDQRRR